MLNECGGSEKPRAIAEKGPQYVTVHSEDVYRHTYVLANPVVCTRGRMKFR